MLGFDFYWMLSTGNNLVRRLASTITRGFAGGKVSTHDEVIDQSKFENDVMLLYKAKDENFIRLQNVGLLGLGTYDFYSYFQGVEPFLSSSDGILSLVIFSIFGVLQLKDTRTPKMIFLHKDGTSVFIDFYSLLGFSYRTVEIPSTDFHGSGPFYHKNSQIPSAKYLENGKKKYLFFKTSNVENEEILKKVFAGKRFKIGDQELAAKISKKTRGRYGL